MDFVEEMLLGVGDEDIGHTGIEPAPEQGKDALVAEGFMLAPLPLVLELRLLRRLVVGGVKVVNARRQTGLHDGKILIGKRDIDQNVGIELLDQLDDFERLIGIHLRRLDFTLQLRGNRLALRLCTAGQTDVRKHVRHLRTLMRHHATHTTRPDDQYFAHSQPP